MKNAWLVLLVLFSPLLMRGAVAAEKKKVVIPCLLPQYRAFDFWAGEWQVFHAESGALAGYDRISRTLRGCALQQSWISLDDHFSSPYVPFRMNGKSFTSFDGRDWVQFWVDNQGGIQILKGGLEKGAMVLHSEPVMGYVYKISWTPQKDGTLRNISQRKKTEEDGGWQTLFDFIYRRNENQIGSPKD